MQDHSPESAIEPVGANSSSLAMARRRRRWPAVLLALAVIVAVLAYGWEASHHSNGDQIGVVKQIQPAGQHLATGPQVGKLAPNFLLKTTQGQTIRLSDLRGRPVLLNFWATWCPYCLSEMPAMQQLADKYGGKLEVVGVNAGEESMKASSYAADHDIHYTLALDSDLAVTHAYRVANMPASLFIDRNGVVRAVNYGPMTTDEMINQIQPLLPT